MTITYLRTVDKRKFCLNKRGRITGQAILLRLFFLQTRISAWQLHQARVTLVQVRLYIFLLGNSYEDRYLIHWFVYCIFIYHTLAIFRYFEHSVSHTCRKGFIRFIRKLYCTPFFVLYYFAELCMMHVLLEHNGS